MTNQEILEKAIQKAIDGGWEQDLIWVHGNVKDKTSALLNRLDIESNLSGNTIYYDYDEELNVIELIFNHNFAKALWSDEPLDQTGPVVGGTVQSMTLDGEEETEYTYTKEKRAIEYAMNPHRFMPLYKWHLQQMVIAENPIKYLGDNL